MTDIPPNFSRRKTSSRPSPLSLPTQYTLDKTKNNLTIKTKTKQKTRTNYIRITNTQICDLAIHSTQIKTITAKQNWVIARTVSVNGQHFTISLYEFT